VLYREDLNRIYVTDGDAGDLKIFDGTTYGLVSSVKTPGGRGFHWVRSSDKIPLYRQWRWRRSSDISMLSVVDTTAGEKLADLKIDGETLEAMTLRSPPRNVCE